MTNPQTATPRQPSSDPLEAISLAFSTLLWKCLHSVWLSFMRPRKIAAMTMSVDASRDYLQPIPFSVIAYALVAFIVQFRELANGDSIVPRDEAVDSFLRDWTKDFSLTYFVTLAVPLFAYLTAVALALALVLRVGAATSKNAEEPIDTQTLTNACLRLTFFLAGIHLTQISAGYLALSLVHQFYKDRSDLVTLSIFGFILILLLIDAFGVAQSVLPRIAKTCTLRTRRCAIVMGALWLSLALPTGYILLVRIARTTRPFEPRFQVSLFEERPKTSPDDHRPSLAVIVNIENRNPHFGITIRDQSFGVRVSDCSLTTDWFEEELYPFMHWLEPKSTRVRLPTVVLPNTTRSFYLLWEGDEGANGERSSGEGLCCRLEVDWSVNIDRFISEWYPCPWLRRANLDNLPDD